MKWQQVKEKFKEINNKISKLEQDIKLLQNKKPISPQRGVKKNDSDGSNENHLGTQSRTGEESKVEQMPVSGDNQPLVESSEKDTKEKVEPKIIEKPKEDNNHDGGVDAVTTELGGEKVQSTKTSPSSEKKDVEDKEWVIFLEIKKL